MLLVGGVHVEFVTHDVLIPVMLEAVVDSECAPVVNVVDVIVKFQPPPLPLASITVSPSK